MPLLTCNGILPHIISVINNNYYVISIYPLPKVQMCGKLLQKQQQCSSEGTKFTASAVAVNCAGGGIPAQLKTLNNGNNNQYGYPIVHVHML